MKIITVECCGDCPFIVSGAEKPYCDKARDFARVNTTIDNRDSIPSWCPLEDDEKMDIYKSSSPSAIISHINSIEGRLGTLEKAILPRPSEMPKIGHKDTNGRDIRLGDTVRPWPKSSSPAMVVPALEFGDGSARLKVDWGRCFILARKGA